MNEQDSVIKIKGIGEKSQKLLEKLDIYTIHDLLKHYPREYDSYGEITYINTLMAEETYVIVASLKQLPKTVRRNGLVITSCIVSDGSGQIELIWFNMPFMQKLLKIGIKYIFRGKVTVKSDKRIIRQPKILTKEDYYNNKNKLLPVYALTAHLTNNMLTKYIRTAMDEVELGKEVLSKNEMKEYNLITHKKAINQIHFPDNEQIEYMARRRIVFEEFYDFLMGVKNLKSQKIYMKTESVIKEYSFTEKIINSLDFELTQGQKEAWESIRNDMNSEYAMNRLIQGDVGCGKTIVALLAMAAAYENGYQSALMVPTQVLAKQHFEYYNEVLSCFGVKVLLLDGTMKQSEKKEAYKKIKSHEADMVIGTHALIQEAVEFDNLALVITDEQHRFGVRQRKALAGKGDNVHMLVMSATPIPRSLAIVLYADLDISIIKSMPAQRKPIKNCVVTTKHREASYKFIEKEVKNGHQAFVICPMVDESENIEAENCVDYSQMLQEKLSDDIKVEYIHGKMKPAQKNEIMESFIKGEIKVLVSTTVIEVGINVPNATVMMIENAERFGLAQLHQLRGRVGRSDLESYCIFMTANPSEKTMERLNVLNNSNDGFYISNEDLKLRGPGDIFGVRQSGLLEFKLADIYADADLLRLANDAVHKE